MPSSTIWTRSITRRGSAALEAGRLSLVHGSTETAAEGMAGLVGAVAVLDPSVPVPTMALGAAVEACVPGVSPEPPSDDAPPHATRRSVKSMSATLYITMTGSPNCVGTAVPDTVHPFLKIRMVKRAPAIAVVVHASNVEPGGVGCHRPKGGYWGGYRSISAS